MYEKVLKWLIYFWLVVGVLYGVHLSLPYLNKILDIGIHQLYSWIG